MRKAKSVEHTCTELFNTQIPVTEITPIAVAQALTIVSSTKQMQTLGYP